MYEPEVQKFREARESRYGLVAASRLNIGCFFGIQAFTYVTQYTNRRKAFAMGFIAAMLMTSFTFW